MSEENQRACDREMRDSRSATDRTASCSRRDSIHRINRVKDIIRDLERHGPAGLIHVNIISHILGKPIRIWNSDGTFNRIIGKEKKGQPVDIEYHTTDSESIGHWTLKGSKDPIDTKIDLNSCLFSVIGSQTGDDPCELRRLTVLRLKGDHQWLIKQVDELLQLEKDGTRIIALMIGGARYTGQSAEDAKRYLDRSHNKPCHKCGSPGHPRGHASHPLPDCSGSDSAEAFSARPTPTTAFLSRDDQDLIAHLVLKSEEVQKTMEKFKKEHIKIEVYQSAETLADEGDITIAELPKMRTYHQGAPISDPEAIRSIVMVLRHHEGKHETPDAEVFIQTFFPTKIAKYKKTKIT